MGIHYDHRRTENLDTQLRALLAPLLPRLGNALEANRVKGRRAGASATSALTAQIVEPSFVVDEDGYILEANEAAKVLLGQNEFVGATQGGHEDQQ